MGRIGIVELAFHNEVLRSYINLIKEVSSDIVCYTNEFCHKQLYDYIKDQDVKWQIKTESNNKEYFSRVKDSLASCDRIVIITLDEDLDFFGNYQWPAKATFLIHDFYAYFSPRKINFKGDLKQKLRAGKSLLMHGIKGERAKKKKLLAQMDSLAVPSVHVQRFVQKGWPDLQIGVLEFAVPRVVKKENKDGDYIQISIPGNVIQKSRDYVDVVKAFRSIHTQIKIRTRLVILGQAKTNYGRNVFNQLSSFQNDMFEVNSYDGFIEQEDFDTVLAKSDFLLLPISEIMYYRHFKEQNGYTCVSGNINDMYYHGVPAILPQFYPLQEEAAHIVSRYTDAQSLSKTLLDWINNRSFQQKQTNANSTMELLRKKSIERAKNILST